MYVMVEDVLIHGAQLYRSLKADIMVTLDNLIVRKAKGYFIYERTYEF